MKILVNATNLRIGGGVQKAVEFIRASVAAPGGDEFFYAISDVVATNLRSVTRVEDERLLVAKASPSRPWPGNRTKERVLDCERRVRPDVVFSIFGPAYIRFTSPHLMGFAIPWVTHPNRYAWQTLKYPWTRAWYAALIARAASWARFAEQWVLETDVAADGLARVLGLPRDRFHVVPNVCGEQYYSAMEHPTSAVPESRMAKRAETDFHLLCFSAWYPHKNLELVPAVAEELKRVDPARQYRFFLTFDPSLGPWKKIESDASRRGVAASVINLGPILVGDGPRAYESVDALFLPTVLESFTATYPEAMCMRRPIITTDLPFAREICGPAAAYFEPMNARAGAARIAELARSETLRNELVRQGSLRLSEGRRPSEIHAMFLELLELTARRTPARQSEQ